MKKEKIYLGFLLIFICSFSSVYAEEQLAEATPLQFIAIMIESQAFDQAEELLDLLSKKEKKSFDYFYLSAKLEEGKGNNESAIKFYRKAWEKDKKNLIPRLNILSIYIKDKKYKRKLKKEFKSISKLKMSGEERKEFESLKKLFETTKKKNYILSLSVGVTATDNVASVNENAESDTIANLNLAFAHQKVTKNKFIFTSFVSYTNSTYSTTTEKNSNSIAAGFEPGKSFTSWQLSTPLMVNYTMENGEESSKGYSAGLKTKKIFKNQANIGVGVNMSYTDNVASAYDGNMLSYYLEFGKKTKSERNYKIKLNAESTDYSLESENYTGIGGTLSTDKVYAGKFQTSLTYTVIQKEYDIDREDLTHTINTDFKANIFKTKWKYILAYSYTMNDSNSSDYEYVANQVSLKIKRDF